MTKRKLASSRGSRTAGNGPAAPRRVPATRYIESSALVAALLEGDAAAKTSIRARGIRVTSGLTVAESNRAFLRARLSGRITAQQHRDLLLSIQRFARRTHIVAISKEILAWAGSQFPVEPVRTLDAIHLATASAIGESPALVTIVTRDGRVRDNAIALGHPIE